MVRIYVRIVNRDFGRSNVQLEGPPGGEADGEPRSTASSRSVQRPKGARLSAMLCLARTAGVWRNQSVPAVMTRLAKKGLRPAVCFIAKQVIRCPVMTFCAFRFAYFADVAWLNRFYFINIEAKSGYCRLAYKPPKSKATVPTNELKGFVFCLINHALDVPLLFKQALFARDVWPAKGLLRHEELPVLR